jgi:carbon storage regulator
MLVLTRKSNQSIMIGDDIEVSVLSIMGEKVRIGIQAPRDIPVFRKEVYLEIQEERGGVGVTVAPSSGSERSGERNGEGDSSTLRAEVDSELRKLGGS